MAATIPVSASSSSIVKLNVEHHRRGSTPKALSLASSSAYSHSFASTTKLSLLSSRSSKTQPRILPRVEAKKQTFSNFDDLLKNSDKPVFVDFYATWCGPCQFMVPVLNEVSDSMKDKIQIVKIDTEKYPAIADKYNIQALPTFIMFKDGEPCDRFEGALPADKLIERIEAALKAKE